MRAELAVVGGTGFQMKGRDEVVGTPYGPVRARFTEVGGRRAVFIMRHGIDHLPPHRVNYRAIIWGAREAGARRVVATNTVGTMSHHPVGSLFLPDDFVEFTKSRPNTFFEDRAVHVDMSVPYCPELRSALADAAASIGLQTFEGVYACAEGPHLESPAQIRMMRQFGDVVGMTGYPEVVLARELGLCYASLCLVTNPACGLAPGKLSLDEIIDEMKVSGERAKKVIEEAFRRLPEERRCECAGALQTL